MARLGETRAAPFRASGKDELRGIVRVLMCGSVDDGKSTLIGRLLWDVSAVRDDHRAAILGHGNQPDFSRLVDGLMAEREQGITIDIAWQYLEAGACRLVVIDSPGHEQYTRNMASGASHADVAVLLVDARHGIKQQTRRHAALLSLFGVKRVVLAVNKMDLVDWSETRFRALSDAFASIAETCGFDASPAVPVCAVGGDNVVAGSEQMPWYHDGTMLDHIAVPQDAKPSAVGPLRFPVQHIVRDGNDFRGIAGTVASGSLSPGDQFRDPATGQSATVKRLVVMDGDLDVAGGGQAVTIVPDRDLDVSRGAVLSSPDQPPVMAYRLEGRIVWTSENGFDPGAHYLLRTATDLTPVAQIAVTGLVDLDSMTMSEATRCDLNEIAGVTIHPSRPIALDRFSDVQATGSFLLVDAVSGHTVAGGVVIEVSERPGLAPAAGFRLSRTMLARGVCRDLGASAAEQAEFDRRANEVAYILAAAGVRVDLTDFDHSSPS